MQTLKVEVQDNLIEKRLWLLNSFKGVKVETLTKKELFLDEVKNSEDDILIGNVSKITDIDAHIQELKNATT